MENCAPKLQKFIVWAPDYTDEGTLELRMSVREAHLGHNQKYIDDGTIRVGGGVLTADSFPGKPDMKFHGSFLLYEVESIEVVRNFIETDIYYTAGVWDKDKIVILPVVLATPFP
ncbi:hypothetical protein BJ138DRAFT_1088295 [Hygrophoropsis aurantiaca]|uniref:Uncharacterized protein n=1 Tax=Hygrophoropsis aurantiaca TaxID=72124 RepID=A0ACB8AAM4_9AGAM|nr:hypothetical protein BJ138DRAFT_1088295 [Hygrophoropsis aurantiaca]